MKITVRTLLKKPIFTVPKSDEIIKRTKTAEIEKMGRNEKVESQKRPYLSPTGIRIGETARPQRPRRGSGGRLFAERGAEHETAYLEAPGACGVGTVAI